MLFSHFLCIEMGTEMMKREVHFQKFKSYLSNNCHTSMGIHKVKLHICSTRILNELKSIIVFPCLTQNQFTLKATQKYQKYFL